MFSFGRPFLPSEVSETTGEKQCLDAVKAGLLGEGVCHDSDGNKVATFYWEKISGENSLTQEKELDDEIEALEAQHKEYLAYIDLLHDYNDAKDNGQSVFGMLARAEGVTVSDIYDQLDMDLDD